MTALPRVTFTLRPRAPFRLDATVWILRRRPENQLDRWDGTTYRRALLLPRAAAAGDGRSRPSDACPTTAPVMEQQPACWPVELAVRQVGPVDDPVLSVQLSGAGPEAIPAATAWLTRTLGLDVDLEPFLALAARDPRLGPLVMQFRGARPTRYPSLFEALVNAIVCQQVTLSFGITLLNRFVQAFGVPVFDETAPSSGEPAPRAFPPPDRIAACAPEDFRPLSFSRQKGQAVIEAARAVLAGALDKLETLPDDQAIAHLRTVRGIGRWSAEYVLLRGLGRTHIFPGDDVGARRNVQRWLDVEGTLDYDRLAALLAPWRSFAGFIYFSLLLRNLAERGLLAETAPIAEPFSDAEPPSNH